MTSTTNDERAMSDNHDQYHAMTMTTTMTTRMTMTMNDNDNQNDMLIATMTA